LYNYCRACSLQSAKRDYRRHHEARKTAQRRYAKRPEVAARKEEYSKTYYARHRERDLRLAKQWRLNNLDRRREYVRAWNAKNRDMVRAYQKNYKAKKRSTGRAAVSSAAWRLIRMAFRNRCVYCGNEVARLEQDHVIALARGGEHLPHNVVPACRHCNATKIYNEAPPFWWVASA
jgi:hypothetical protein